MKGKKLKFDSVLIITYGRSGSTLLQGVLNSIEGVLIRGENANMCYHMFQAYKAIIIARKYKAKKDNPKPWYGNTAQNAWFGCEFLNEDNFTSIIKRFVHTSLLGDQKNNSKIRCVGFKEIRYTVEDIGDDFEEYLEFLKELFVRWCERFARTYYPFLKVRATSSN